MIYLSLQLYCIPRSSQQRSLESSFSNADEPYPSVGFFLTQCDGVGIEWSLLLYTFSNCHMPVVFLIVTMCRSKILKVSYCSFHLVYENQTKFIIQDWVRTDMILKNYSIIYLCVCMTVCVWRQAGNHMQTCSCKWL